jgi:hypothetical protein
MVIVDETMLLQSGNRFGMFRVLQGLSAWQEHRYLPPAVFSTWYFLGRVAKPNFENLHLARFRLGWHKVCGPGGCFFAPGDK